MSKSDNFGEKMKEFMQKYDKNSDGKIEMAEVRAVELAEGRRPCAYSTHGRSLKHPQPNRTRGAFSVCHSRKEGATGIANM